MKLTIPELSLVALIGVSGAGKSTFAAHQFRRTEILSSDAFRGLVADDESDMSASSDAFELLHLAAAKRLARGKLTVIDATNTQKEVRRPLVALARQYHCVPVAIVFDLPETLCNERMKDRLDRPVPRRTITAQASQLRNSLRTLKEEGFRYIFVFRTVEEIENIVIEREPSWTDLRKEKGPFDIIGDVHGCFDELHALVQKLGYEVGTFVQASAPVDGCVSVPEGRRAIFLGDLVDRGPRIADVLRLVMGMARSGQALCVPGNHESKLLRALQGRNVQLSHGLDESLRQLELESGEFRAEVIQFLDRLVGHYVLDEGKLVVAHAGMKEAMQGRASRAVREFALYGETTGETDEFGMPVRYPWATDYRGKAIVVYGHTPIPKPEWLNNTICIDTGCVYGGRLTALRYPEKEIVSVDASRVYRDPIRPLSSDVPSPGFSYSEQQSSDDLLSAQDILGKRVIETSLLGRVTIPEDKAAAAFEAMGRFATNPKWLITLPPTMSPTEASFRADVLEHAEDAFRYFKKHEVARVVCEKKHMGSRAIVVLCKNESVAARRFGIAGEGRGCIFTRTGRRFFDDQNLEAELLGIVGAAFERAGTWIALDSDWACLDCELMPWSAKAHDLLVTQYASTAAAGKLAMQTALLALAQAEKRQPDVKSLLDKFTERRRLLECYEQEVQRYCWPVSSVSDLRLAPFHILASEGSVHADKSHLWHLNMIASACAAAAAGGGAPVLIPTDSLLIEPANEDSVRRGILWWEAAVASGAEGMVVKPETFVTRWKRTFVQPAIKCRGPEYLRIIYGPEYTLPENLERLRKRNVGLKRSLALREFALGLESLERFVRQEPLRRVHECVFGILALESEVVDPRL